MLFQQHSILPIPREPMVSRIQLLEPLIMNNLDNPLLVTGSSDPYGQLRNSMSIVIPGDYELSRDVVHFTKTRGELQAGVHQYHVEVIWWELPDHREPMIVRVWGLGEDHPQQQEYVVSDVMIRLRHHRYGAMINTNGILFQLTDALMPYQDPPDPLVASMFGYYSPSLIPNTRLGEHVGWLQQMIPQLPQCSNNEDFMRTFAKIVFGPLGEPREMNYLMGVLQGEVRGVHLTPFRHSGTYSDQVGTTMYGTLSTADQYFATLALGQSIFDHYEVQVDIQSGQIDIYELDTMGGPRVPLQFLKSANLYNTVQQYLGLMFSVQNQIGGHYYHEIGGRRYHIDQVNIKRTMDERLVITLMMEDTATNVPSEPVICEQEFDLILLSILTPTLTLTPPNGFTHLPEQPQPQGVNHEFLTTF